MISEYFFHFRYCRARRNDRVCLYQHTSRCPVAMQLFLDANPDYWCFVPIHHEDAATRLDSTIPPSHLRSASIELGGRHSRNEDDVKYLVDSLLQPPPSYIYTTRQNYAQKIFFRAMKDQLSSETNVDLYNASIVAVCMYIRKLF